MENMSNILKNTKGFAKNPLGIIALFISLVYGFACIVLSTASSNLEPIERIPLIWFLVLFPIIIMFSFLFLVTKHHRKLYGPSDFKDEKIFLETIDIKTQKRILSESTVIKTKDFKDKSDLTHSKSERLKNYLISENLILRILEKQYNLPIKRNVRFTGHKNWFDGIIESEKKIIGIEIKYWDKIDNDFNESVSLHYKRRLHTFQRVVKQYYSNRKFLLELVVIANCDNKEFKLVLDKLMAKETGVNIRFLKFNDLKKQFGIQEDNPFRTSPDKEI
jgi:hypothetical protein